MISLLYGACIVSWQTLRAHKVRTLLTCLSLAIAVLALVIVDAASQIASTAVVAEARLSQGLPETWLLTFPAGSGVEAKAQRAKSLAQAILGPSNGSAVLIAEASARLNGTGVTVIAVKGDLRSIRPYRLVSGGWLVASATPNYSPELVLNKPAASLLGGGAPHLTLPGSALVISARNIGVVDDLGSTPTIYLNLDDVLLWSGLLPDRWSLNILGHASSERPGEAAVALKEASSVSELEADPPVRIDGLGPTADALATVRLTFLLVAAVALLVGTLGILNIGLVSLHERVEEIALRRATGALALQIGLSVVMESVLTALVAALGACVLAWVAVPLVAPALFSNLSLAASLDFPYQTAIVGIAVAGAAGFAGGIIPAARATRIQIANVMRA